MGPYVGVCGVQQARSSHLFLPLLLSSLSACTARLQVTQKKAAAIQQLPDLLACLGADAASNIHPGASLGVAWSCKMVWAGAN